LIAENIDAKSLIGIVRVADLAAAARLMTDHNIGALGVYSADQHELVGIITERDITRAVARGLDPATTRVEEMMSTTLIIAEAPVTNAEAARLMQNGHVRHLIVREEGADRIVSLRDV
jgi:CBS domain-containing protein